MLEPIRCAGCWRAGTRLCLWCDTAQTCAAWTGWAGLGYRYADILDAEAVMEAVQGVRCHCPQRGSLCSLGQGPGRDREAVRGRHAQCVCRSAGRRRTAHRLYELDCRGGLFRFSRQAAHGHGLERGRTESLLTRRRCKANGKRCGWRSRPASTRFAYARPWSWGRGTIALRRRWGHWRWIWSTAKASPGRVG